MKVVVNKSDSHFRLSYRAYTRLIALGCPVVPADDMQEDELGVIRIYDNMRDGCVISDNPDDAEGDHGWLHTDARYFDVVTADEGWSRAFPELIRVVEELGEHAGQGGCIPTVVDIGNDFDSWTIVNSNGRECVQVTRGRGTLNEHRDIIWP